MKNPHDILIAPRITERSVALSYGDPRIKDEKELNRKYTFMVAPDANKLEIKQAFETIFNEGKKAEDRLVVESVRTMRVLGKRKRRGLKVGYTVDRKKAIITLAKGQILEEFGV